MSATPSTPAEGSTSSGDARTTPDFRAMLAGIEERLSSMADYFEVIEVDEAGFALADCDDDEDDEDPMWN